MMFYSDAVLSQVQDRLQRRRRAMRQSSDGPIPEALASTIKHTPAKRKLQASQQSPSTRLQADTRSPKKVSYCPILAG